jgi:Dolichyl-phosphate-mannose-protein mannosyltransferase
VNLKTPTSSLAYSPIRNWLSERLAAPARLAADDPAGNARGSRCLRLAVACVIVFLLASGVMLLHWQDSYLSSGLGSLTHRYLKHAGQMLDGQGILFPRDFNEPSNAQLLVHPPGYSIFAAAVFGLFGTSNDKLTVAQIIAAGGAAVMVTIIAAEVFPLAVGVLAGLLAAFSPHLAHYSLFLLPDSLSVLPILIAVYFLVRSVKQPRLATVMAAGFFIGLSCWLRSNTLFLAVFVAATIWLLFGRSKRRRYSLALLAAAIITILPITIRNLAVFGRFIPLSLGAGITMIEGIADYDTQRRFGMPVSDFEGKMKDAEWHNRPDYAEGLWKPDGIERDRYRFSRGLDVIVKNPAWFAGVMCRRAMFMLNYNSPESKGWPFDTARVPVVSMEASFGHQPEIPAETISEWAVSAAEMKANGNQFARQSVVSLSEDRQTLRLEGDNSAFGDQITSAPIAVEPNTDYVLTLKAKHVSGLAAAKVTSADRRITLASAIIVAPDEGRLRNAKAATEAAADDDEAETEVAKLQTDAELSIPVFDLPFATGNGSEVLLVISNNGQSSTRPVVEIGQAQLYKLSPTPHVWTKLVRPSVRGIQRNLYTTSRLLPLVIIGIILLSLAGQKRALVVLLVVPVYYLTVQSVFHTEYRYILSIHCFLFVMAAVTIYCAGRLIGQGTHRSIEALKKRRVKAAS